MKSQLHKRTRTKICVATSSTTGKIRVHIKPGLDVFVNTPEEVAKIKAKYSAHTIVVPVRHSIQGKFFGK